MTDLFEELPTPAWLLRSRLVMAPLTRNRADEAGVPGDLAVEYYAQRASVDIRGGAYQLAVEEATP